LAGADYGVVPTELENLPQRDSGFDPALLIVDSDAACSLGSGGVERIARRYPELQLLVLGSSKELAAVRAAIPGTAVWYLAQPLNT
ncbi:MAG: hypothetical protein KDD69_14465, partial [Bdellovibrionales bacterium]|nr:hypothetical protein [Bdellovibrionales bacterium]